METGWNLAFLPKALEDLVEIEPSKERQMHIRRDIEDEFHGLKGDRVAKVLIQGSSSSSVDRLKAAQTPGSIRVQVQGGLRATALCLPAFTQAYVTHIFSKSQDPQYKKAPGIHDGRVSEFVTAFDHFVNG